MSITRLSGGLTPADGSDPRTFPEIFNGVADTIESQGSAITGAESDIDDLESDVTALQGDSIPTDVTSPVAGDKLVFDGTNFVNLEAYAFVETVYFESNGTFSKGDYPWLRAIRVKVTGGGSGGGRSRSIRCAGGGGAGATAEKFIADITVLSSSISVTVGAGGAGSTLDNTPGGPGGDSEFDITIPIIGGGGLTQTAQATSGGLGGTATGGDLNVFGGDGNSGAITSTQPGGGSGGGSFYGSGGGGGPGGTTGAFVGQDGRAFGSGGGGSRMEANGGDGADGIVVVELFA